MVPSSLHTVTGCLMSHLEPFISYHYYLLSTVLGFSPKNEGLGISEEENVIFVDKKSYYKLKGIW